MYKLDKEKRDKLEAEIKSLKDVIEQLKQLLSEKADEMLDINLPEPNLITCHTEQEQKNLQLHGDLSNELTDLQSSLLKYEQVIVAKEQEHDTVIGPHETILNASLKDLKMSTERYFAGDAMTGNKECNAYKSIRENDFCKKFPVYFPTMSLTRKMIELSLVLPKFIRTKPVFFTMFRLEQEGEHIHKLLNDIERILRNTLNREERYFKIIKEYENKVYCFK